MHVVARHWVAPGGRPREPAGTGLGGPPLSVVWRVVPERIFKRIFGRSERSRGDRTSLPRGGAFGQILLIVGAWIVYSLARSLSGDDVVSAVHRGRILQNWDAALGFGFTLDVNHWVTAHGILAIPMTLEYASLHYLITPLVLVWLWRFHPENYRPALLALIAMSAVGLVVYVVLPVAPPRLLPNSGWIDTMSSWSQIGWWGNGGSAPAGFEHLTDQFAAMPSLHAGWAVWCAWVWRRTGGSFSRRLGWIYPASIAATVVATANHYVLDVVAGVLLALIACALAPRLLARSAKRSDRPKTISAWLPGERFGEGVQAFGRSMGFVAGGVIDLRAWDELPQVRDGSDREATPERDRVGNHERDRVVNLERDTGVAVARSD